MQAKPSLIVLLVITFSACGTAVGQATAPTKAPAKASVGDSGIKDNGDGTVTDKKTGLMWQKDVSKDMTWPDGQKYCHDLSLAAHSDWILPKKDQLVSVWSDGGFRSLDDFTWSSEIDPDYTPQIQLRVGPMVWIVKSKTGEVSHGAGSESTKLLNPARCVRVAK